MEPTTLLLILASLALAFGAGFWLGRRHSIRLATELAVAQARLRSEEALEVERSLALTRPWNSSTCVSTSSPASSYMTI